jgi:hypothetical protein
MREPAEGKVLQLWPQDDEVMARGGESFWNVNGSNGGERFFLGSDFIAVGVMCAD